MEDQAPRWIAQQEGHLEKRLRRDNPSSKNMATSAPLGEFDEILGPSWETRAEMTSSAESFVEFQEQAEFLRRRLIGLLETAENMLQRPASATDNVADVLAALRVIHSEFRELHNSPLAWQSIDAEDTELLSRAATLLRRCTSRTTSR